MAVVYRHRRLDTFEVFYVGIGKTQKRPHSKLNRNKWWTNITNKTEYTSEILYSDISWEDACELEKFLISEYGRMDLRTGKLVNLTDGGEGTLGVIFSEKTRTKMSEAKKGKPSHNYGKKASKEAREKMSISATGRKHSEESKEKNRIASSNVSEETKLKRYLKNKGLKRTPEQCKRISESKMNTLLLDVVNGIYYKSMSEVCRIFGYSRKGIIRKLDNIEKNDTNLIRV